MGTLMFNRGTLHRADSLWQIAFQSSFLKREGSEKQPAGAFSGGRKFMKSQWRQWALCLTPEFRGNTLKFVPLTIVLATGLSSIIFIMLKYVLSICVLQRNRWAGE